MLEYGITTCMIYTHIIVVFFSVHSTSVHPCTADIDYLLFFSSNCFAHSSLVRGSRARFLSRGRSTPIEGRVRGPVELGRLPDRDHDRWILTQINMRDCEETNKIYGSS